MYTKISWFVVTCFSVGLVLSSAVFAVTEPIDMGDDEDLVANINMISTTSDPVKQESSEKIDTREIQKALANAGYFKGDVDGIMGPKTRRAIREFQKDNGLKIDGKCGPRTWTKLKEHLAEAVKTEDAIAKDLAATTTPPAEGGISALPKEGTKPSQSGELKQKLVS